MEWKEKISEWTGFDYVLCVQSGTAAIEMVMDVLTGGKPTRVNLPALGCWTIAGCIQSSGHQVIFKDIDENLYMQCNSLPAKSLVFAIEPWGSPGNWQEIEIFQGKKVIDLTLSIFGSWPGRKAADHFDAGVISCGSGKPMDIGAGGITMFKRKSDYLAASKLLFYGREGLRWKSIPKRFVFSHHLYQELDKVIDALFLKSKKEGKNRSRCYEVIKKAKLPLELVLPEASLNAGISQLYPVLLAKEFPLSAEDVYRAALVSRIPLLLQPVSPPYHEDAWGQLKGKCPNAERIAKRLLFIPSNLLAADHFIDEMRRFFKVLSQHSADYKYPYRTKKPSIPLPDYIAHLKELGILGKDLDGNFQVFDQLLCKLYKISEGLAQTLIQKTIYREQEIL